MFLFLAAVGLSQYSKRLHIYLQHMQKLRHRQTAVPNAITQGRHDLCRSGGYWAGLSTDLVIEQVLMRSVKSAGGLTGGRGMADSQQTQWRLSTPACADVNDTLQGVTGLEHCTSEQHVEAGEDRKTRDRWRCQHLNTSLECCQHLNTSLECCQHLNTSLECCQHLNTSLECCQHLNTSLE